MINLNIEKVTSEATLLAIVLAGTQASPFDLAEIDYPHAEGTKGLVISGFPQWAIGSVALYYKNRVSWIAFVDPKLKSDGEDSEKIGSIIIWTLNPKFKTGSLYFI